MKLDLQFRGSARAPKEAIAREKLFEEVWAEPMTKVAARYDVSSSFLARVCERLRVPRPPRGYWAQLAVGKPVEQPALPAAQPGDELEWSREGGAPRTQPRALPKPPGPSDVAPVVPRATSSGLHPLLDGARGHFDAARVSEAGYLRPVKQLVVDVFVSKDALERALSTANRFFRALGARGHRAVIAPHGAHLQRPELDQRVKRVGESFDWGIRRWSPGRPTVVYMGTLAIGLTLFELSEEVELCHVDGKSVRIRDLRAPLSRHAWTFKQQMPSGRLALRAYSPYHVAKWEREWHEERGRALGGMLDTVVEELERDAVTLAKLVEEGERLAAEERQKWEAQQRERERKRRAEEEEQRRRDEARRAAEEEERRTKALQDEIYRWKFAQEIRAYVAARNEVLVAEGCCMTPDAEPDRWVRWALAHANRIDPIHQLEIAARATVAEHRAKLEALAAAANVTLLHDDGEDP